MFRYLSFCRMVVVLTAVAVVGFAHVAPADEDLPFKGSANAVVTDIAIVGETMHLSLVGSGNATHLGNYTRLEEVDITGPFVDASLVFIAANGDELWIHAVGMFTGPGVVEGTYSITGGTGRFTNATGSAEFIGTTPDFVHLSVSFDGIIDY